jgi:WD40 repeat protein/GTPase SAR1 family protein/3',5'-cyclic AMP phosphodiesterase CpdA
MARLSWLHLSDLLMTRGGTRLNWPEFREEFERDLRVLHQRTGPWDLVLLTGGLTMQGRPSEFAALYEALKTLWEFLRSLGSVPTLIAVPSRSDIETPLFYDWADRWAERHHNHQTVVTENATAAGFYAVFNRQDLRVGVVGLYSANIFLNESLPRIEVPTLQRTGGGDVHKWSREKFCILLLTHLPPWGIHPSSMGSIAERFVPGGEETIFHLCGGWNNNLIPKAQITVTAGRVFQARPLFGDALFQGPGADSSADNLWGYAVGQLSVEDGIGRIQIFPRVLTLAYQERLTFISDHTFHLDSEESLTWPVGPPAYRAPRRITHRAPEASRAPPGLKLSKSLSTDKDGIASVLWSPSGEELAVGSRWGGLQLWSRYMATPRWSQRAHLSKLVEFCFSPDGKALATRSSDNVRTWRVEDGELLQVLNLSTKEGRGLAWSYQGLLAVGLEGGGISLFGSQQGNGLQPQRHRLHSDCDLHCLTWSHDGRSLSYGGGGIGLFKQVPRAASEEPHFAPRHWSLVSPVGQIINIAWMPNSNRLATCSDNGTTHIWNAGTGGLLKQLATGNRVVNLSFSFDGRLFGSRSRDGTVCLFRTDTWTEVARLEMPTFDTFHTGVAFSPRDYTLALVSPQGHEVQLWEVDVEALLGQPAPTKTVHSVSAKVVLVGEGRAGKSSLALRLAEARYEELPSTHGMRLWSLDAAKLSAEPSSSERREIILWDMGGQDEYRLVHQLFFRHTSVALMVMEPGRGKAALDEIEGWDRRLSAQAGENSALRKLLVGSKLDDEFAPQDRPAIEQLVQRSQFESYVLTSARMGRGIQELKAALARAIDWDSLASISQPESFQRIRDTLQRLRESGRVAIPLLELEQELRKTDTTAAEPETLRAAVEHLARQGLVADTRLADGTRMLVLELEQVERYANSLIVAARENPHGVPAVEVAAFSRLATLPRIRPEERLRRDQEVIILDCVVEMLLQHGLCLRHQGLLVFPSLFPPAMPGAGLTHAVSLSYEFSGPVDNIYASLITAIAMSHGFGAMRLWEDRAEFGQAGQDTVGIRCIQAAEQQARGTARLELYFDPETPESKRELFVSYVDMHLRNQNVELVERLAITCACGHTFPEQVVRQRMNQGAQDIGCPACDRRTLLTPGAEQAREKDPQLPSKLRGLRVDMRDQRTQSVVETKMSMMEAQAPAPQNTPIRILHLSDLHIGADTDPKTLLQPLVADLYDSEELALERLDYLVLSGDITNRAAPGEFEKAREFVSELIKEFGLTSERCVIVPGNHDLDWNNEGYDWKPKRQVDVQRLKPGSWCEQGAGYLVRDEARYPERFRHFSEHFYHPLLQREYPLPAEQQCIPFLSAELRLQFLAMNSSWEIDEYFRERSSIHDGALSRGLEAAEQQLKRARDAKQLAADAKVLRLAVWHHPITGNEKMQQDAFLGRLRQAGVRLCLHGHVHEDRADLVNYLDPRKQLHIVGAGSFGAPTHDRPESVPRLYNLLEVARGHSSVRVHTRALRRGGGAWEGWAIWPSPERGQRRTYYEFKLD